MSDLVKLARQRIDSTQRTHWDGCERDHRECLIQRMADEIERLRATLERQQLSYEREREIDQEEIERLRAELAEAVTALPQAIRNERERCAGACEDEARLWEADGKGPATEARLCAARIRSLA